jgi:hypothetical protein
MVEFDELPDDHQKTAAFKACVVNLKSVFSKKLLSRVALEIFIIVRTARCDIFTSRPDRQLWFLLILLRVNTVLPMAHRQNCGCGFHVRGSTGYKPGRFFLRR